MNTLDLAVVIVAVACAAGFLLWQLGLRRDKPPPCHPAGAPPPEGTVVLGDGLARGLDAARRKHTRAQYDRAN